MSPMQRPKGTFDILPSDMGAWHWVEQTARQMLEAANYQEIRTPIFESTDLFVRGVGEGTDIVSKEMYTFEKGDRSLTLRPEYTAPVVRAVAENGLTREPKPLKLYYMGPLFRYERPQEGRQRQFTQLGLEMFGLDSPASDAEIIQMAMAFLNAVGLTNLVLNINNVGDPEDRPALVEGLRKRLKPHLPNLCENCQKRYEKNTLRMLDCKVPEDQAIYDTLTDWLASDALGEASQAHFNEVVKLLDALEIPYRRNVKLVRGLDYYTRTVFEITSENLGAQNAVCGGGRYNHLSASIGGPDVPATGWAIGLERLIRLLDAAPASTIDAYVVTDIHSKAMGVAQNLRDAGIRVEVDLSGKAFGKQFQMANKRQAPFALTCGAQEAESGQWQVKDMATGHQETVAVDELIPWLLARLKSPSTTAPVF